MKEVWAQISCEDEGSEMLERLNIRESYRFAIGDYAVPSREMEQFFARLLYTVENVAVTIIDHNGSSFELAIDDATHRDEIVYLCDAE